MTFRRINMKKILKIFVTFIVFSHLLQASELQMNSFRVENLDLFKGSNLSVYYVSARPASLGLSGQLPKVRKVFKGPLTVKINSNGDAQVPEVSFSRNGWTIFNYVVFVIHKEDKYAFRNADGSKPVFLDTQAKVPYKMKYARFKVKKAKRVGDIKDEAIISLY